jgi:predicted TIM-barrel fold metal-dependent hydrolase
LSWLVFVFEGGAAMKEDKFYDIHFHLMNLSHPYLRAFLARVPLAKYILFGAPLLAVPVLGSIVLRLLEKPWKKVTNLLSFMENDLGSMLKLLEEKIKEDPALYDKKSDTLLIGNKSYSRIVLTPLIMDFGYNHLKAPDLYYGKKSSHKPVTEQVIDLFKGIKDYLEDKETENEIKLFEVYPFLGLNTDNYFLENPDNLLDPEEKIRLQERMSKYFENYTAAVTQNVPCNLRNSLNKMLKKYFQDYAGTEEELSKNHGKNKGDIESLGSNYFAGIKVYPPLGFDPWPIKEKEKMEKLLYLYDYCCQKGIPLTTHCSDGGFKVIDKKLLLENCSPFKWEKVLREFPDLKLNLAHFGRRGEKEKSPLYFPADAWQECILRLIKDYKHVYADFSYSVSNRRYEDLKKLIDKQGEKDKQKLREHILFGSDSLSTFCLLIPIMIICINTPSVSLRMRIKTGFAGLILRVSFFKRIKQRGTSWSCL